MTSINYSFELFEFSEALTPYDIIETNPPSLTSINVNDFRTGDFFRTAAESGTNSLILELEDRLITVILDESGSMTWNDNSRDRYIYLRRLLEKLDNTYPGTITANLIGFGGVPTATKLFLAESNETNLQTDTTNTVEFNSFLQSRFQDSVYDFAGVRIVRRTDRFPNHPADGIVVAEGILDAVKDENLTQGQTYYYGVWTFNKDLLFSRGQFISATPFDRILPSGVNFASAAPRILPGVERDDNTVLIYNFVEGSGTITFDSSGSGFHGTLGSETVEENFWAGDLAAGIFDANGNKVKASGVRFDGDFDIIEAEVDDTIGHDTAILGGTSFSVNFWIYPYDQTGQDVWVIGTLESSITNDVGFAIGITSTGTIGIASGSDISSGFTDTGTSVVYETWQMVTVVFTPSKTKVYINGTSDSLTSLFGSSNTGTYLYIGAKPEDSSVTWSGTDYNGIFANLSIHNTSRLDTYWDSLYLTELELFEITLSQAYQLSPNNNQREVLLSWEIPDNFDYSGGTVKILRKYNEIPAHENDGDLIVSQSASSGTFFYLDVYDFINNSDYYYRVFTINSIGNPCDRDDARILPVHIPKSINEPADPALSQIENLSAIPGNKKVLLQWNNPIDDSFKGLKIFYGEDQYPTITFSPSGELNVSNGFELIDLQSDEFYVHRSLGTSSGGSDVLLTNGKTQYYSIITYDRVGRFSEPSMITAVPSSLLDNVFTPEEVTDLHVDILNPKTLSVQWNNPTVRSDKLDLFFTDAALVFISVKDIFGGLLEDIDNLELKVCTTIQERGVVGSNRPLNNDNGGDGIGTCRIAGVGVRIGDCGSGFRYEDDCNTEQEENETVLTFATIQSGLIKGTLTHISDRQILARRQKYTMDVVARYSVEDEDTGSIIFQYTTKSARVTFTNPFKISAVNRDNRIINIGCQRDGELRGSKACGCTGDPENPCEEKPFNGGYVNANQPYVCRVEVQFKNEALPDGTPVQVGLFKHGDSLNPNPLSDKSDRTFINEGSYPTTAVLAEERDSQGNLTGNTISKSIVDIEIPHPSLSDYVDLYVTLNYLGFFIDIVHEVRFISSLFISADISKPEANGIDISEQFATVWTVDPDNPDDPDSRLPVPDGTLVKWELKKLLFGKERPFYSAETIDELIAGVYSTTTNGVARNIFFGPIGNIQNHFTTASCEDGNISCCVGEEYAIQASVIVGEDSAQDGERFNYPCVTSETSAYKFFMNADASQPFAGGPQTPPHWITWADGIHMLRFKIAQNPNTVLDSQIQGSSCFRSCMDNIYGTQLLPFPLEHIIQINAPAEILWNATFDEDPYTGVETLLESDSISPERAEELGIPFVAPIPISGEVTEFYLRLNAFVDQANPRPVDCEIAGGGGTGGGGGLLPCEWKNICNGVTTCNPTQGIQWSNVSQITGKSTLIVNNKEVTLFGGGGYMDGLPPIYVGFREPLDVRVIDARVNGVRVDELVVDGVSRHTFTVEVKFANEPVPDGTPVELQVTGANSNVVLLSNCGSGEPFCSPGSTGRIYTTLVNDPIINPQDDTGTVDKKSLAYFSVDALPNIAFNAKINVTCRYDKLGTIDREITSCIEVNNTVNVNQNDNVPETGDPTEEAATSNESILYDTVDDTYFTTRAGRIRRIGHFASGVSTGTSDFIYVFGGYTGSGESASNNITPISEQFDIGSQEWAFITDMPTARAYGMSVTVGDVVYCIGGVELDPLLSQYQVSRKNESYDVITGNWMTLAPMPLDDDDEPYGIAYGNAQYANGYIYVTCGVRTIDDSSKPRILNNRVLRYSIVNDEWDFITPSDISLYKRLAPFGFYRSNPTGGGDKHYYIYGGSSPKSLTEISSERLARINSLLDEFRAFVLGSSYFQGLTPGEQEDFLIQKQTEIEQGTTVPAFVYPNSGFKFVPGNEVEVSGILTIDISNTLDNEWVVSPKARDHGQSVYIPNQDIAYFIGGSNQNNSTTLNRVESIDFTTNNEYAQLTSLNRGRAMFGAVAIADEIYLSGGLTSGHKEGYIEIDVQQFPEYVEALGTQSVGLLITLRNDAGEIIDEDVRVSVRGRLRSPVIDDILADFIANRAADRALGGDGSGTATDLPSGADAGGTIDTERLIQAQNKIIDPNSDEFQFNAARKLNESVFLFPILYSQNEFILEGGVGSVTLLPRSEDPLADFEKLSQFIQNTINNTPEDSNQTFEGDLTREELAALGDVLSTIELPATKIDSGTLRELYQIETVITILDNNKFGQTVSDFDLNIQEQIYSKIGDLLTPPDPDESSVGNDNLNLGTGSGGDPVEESECFLLQHSAQPDVPPQSTPSQSNPNSPLGTGGFSQSGQCLFCQSILPLNSTIKPQLPTPLTTFYNRVDWVPQIKQRLTTNDSTISELLEELDIIDYEVPFGGSQLYNALFEASRVMSDDDINSIKKVIYIASDNSQNLSLLTRTDTIDEINSIDGDKKVPVVYTVFSTSSPLSLSAQLDQNGEDGDAAKIPEATGGQSSTLIASSFIDQILNLTIGSATGGLGYGIYNRTLEFTELTAITDITLSFILPSNTQGFFRYRYSSDGFNFTDWSERFEGSGTLDIIDFFAISIEFEVILTTGFTEDITEEYDAIATEIPKLTNIQLQSSGEREDFIFINKEDTIANVQQVAAAFEGDIPTNSVVEIGAATSNSHNWSDFQSIARPALVDQGKMFMLERSSDAESLVPDEILTTIDQKLYKTVYGSWDSTAGIQLIKVDSNNNETTITSGFTTYPRNGEIYFDTRQNPTDSFKLIITNKSCLRVGLRLRNRLHTDSINVRGAGFIFSTNDDKPPALSQVAPRAINVTISPTSPNAQDTIFAIYDFVDLNRNTESGSLIKWYRNGKELIEIQNKSSWTNSDLMQNNKLQPDDKIYFSITPSDGIDFGSTVYSAAIRIAPVEPGASNVRIIPVKNGIVNSRFDTESTLTADYTFNTDDTGTSSIENGTIIRWYVNGDLFKEGTFSVGDTEDPYNDPKTIEPNESSLGVLAHIIGNQVQVEVTPRTNLITGTTTTSNTITIENTVPRITDPAIEPLTPNVNSTILLGYTINDIDITSAIQTDQTEIKWFKSTDGGTTFSEVTSLAGLRSVTPNNLTAGEQWKAQLTPFDGLDLGPTVDTNIITINPV